MSLNQQLAQMVVFADQVQEQNQLLIAQQDIIVLQRLLI
jgi:hypothetical protein